MEWINILDKWPDDENEILVCTISKKGVRNIDKGYALGDRIVHRGTAQVTHWMPLPDMPEERPGCEVIYDEEGTRAYCRRSGAEAWLQCFGEMTEEEKRKTDCKNCGGKEQNNA